MEVAEGVPKALPFSQILFPLFLVSAPNPGLGLLSEFGFGGFFLLQEQPRHPRVLPHSWHYCAMGMGIGGSSCPQVGIHE